MMPKQHDPIIEANIKVSIQLQKLETKLLNLHAQINCTNLECNVKPTKTNSMTST